MCSLTALRGELLDFNPKWNNSPGQRKCGDVFISLATTSLSLHCAFCEFNSDSLENFLKHFKNQHFDVLAVETTLLPEATINELHIKQEELELNEAKLPDDVNSANENAADPLMAECENFTGCAVKCELDEWIPESDGEESEEYDGEESEESDSEESDESDEHNSQHNSDAERPKFQHICRLIHYIREHPIIWDTKLGSHYIRCERKSAIESVTELLVQEYPNLSIDAKYVRNKFTDLKNIYYNFNKSKTKPNKNYERYYELLHFLKDHEKTKESKNLCKVCNKDVACLPRHMQKYHCKNDIPNYFKCDTCEEILPSTEHLKKHIRVVHRRYECEHCARTPYTNSTSLRRHMETIHPEIDLPRKHPSRGHKERICEHCGRQFKSQHKLRIHIKCIHLQLHPYACPDCPRKFDKKDKLRSHRNSAHLNNREHVCDVCSKAFFDRKTMIQHKRLHSDVMNYVCRVCCKAFRQAPALHSHMRTHHEKL